MPHLSRRQLISWLTATAAASVVPGDLRSEANAESPEINALNDSLSIVSKHRIVYSAPPAHIPKSVSVDAPFLGNGDLLAAFAGEPHLPQFWLTTNDFWELRPWGGPRPLGRIVFEIPALKNASYHVEQDLTQATLTGTFAAAGKVLRLTSWIAATENLLLIELESNAGALENYSTVPNAIHEMMLLSHENVLRFFRVWPRKIAPNARFSSLWAYGGFCVSAALRGGEVAFVAIESKKGRDCTFENPWPGWPVKITRTGGVTERLRGNRKTLKTYSGEKILLERA